MDFDFMAFVKEKRLDLMKVAESFGYEPLGDIVVILPDAADRVSRGGIILADVNMKAEPQRGFVIAVGKGKVDEDGNRFPMYVKPGDIVLFNRYEKSEILVDDKKYTQIGQRAIYGIFKEGA